MDDITVEPKELAFDSKQLEAIEACCNMSNRVAVVTGGAGTGKTTILKTIYEKLVDAGYRVALVSPTGKAAKRIREVTGINAMTIHMALEYSHPGDPDPKTGKPVGFSFPRRKRDNPLDYDVVLADEYAMVNTDVHRALFDALPNGACIRVFGDNNQLQPIEEDKNATGPSPFVQLLNNAKFHSTRLDTIHRQGKDSGILLNLQSILRGRMPTKNEQWDAKFTDHPVRELQELLLDAAEEGIDWTSVDNQIITPQNTSWVGTVKLNAMIQMLYHNQMEPSAKIPRHNWSKYKGDGGDDGDKSMRVFVGDKVIITRNMYDLHVFNGESGKIIEITSDDELIIDFGDREQAIPPILMVQNRYGKTVEIDPRKDVDLGYAITTHKSQGSEYSRVIYMLNKSMLYMCNRRNLYTACGRARDHLTLISDQRTLFTSLSKQG